MTDDKNIRELIKEHFNYLVTDYGFVDDPEIKADKIYSEVRFKKNDWTISIVTTAHGTKISMNLISPEDDFGFLNHYFKTVDKGYETKSKTKTLGDNIQFHSDFLRSHGQDLSRADPKRLTDILSLTKSEQMKWVEPLTRRHSDK
jgi:hypothetical protein